MPERTERRAYVYRQKDDEVWSPWSLATLGIDSLVAKAHDREDVEVEVLMPVEEHREMRDALLERAERGEVAIALLDEFESEFTARGNSGAYPVKASIAYRDVAAYVRLRRTQRDLAGGREAYCGGTGRVRVPIPGVDPECAVIEGPCSGCPECPKHDEV